MERCAVNECEKEGTEPWIVLGRKKIFGKGHKVELKAWVCAEHEVAARDKACAYRKPSGVLYILENSADKGARRWE